MSGEDKPALDPMRAMFRLLAIRIASRGHWATSGTFESPAADVAVATVCDGISEDIDSIIEMTDEEIAEAIEQNERPSW